MGVVLRGDLGEGFRPVRRNYEDVAVHSQVFPVAAPNVQPDGSRLLAEQEPLYNRPWLRWLACCWYSAVNKAGRHRRTLYRVDEKWLAICW